VRYQIRLVGSLLEHLDGGGQGKPSPTGWVDCSLEEYLHAEQVAGLISQHPGQPASQSFTGNGIEGRSGCLIRKGD
jgi:hypothetical protein